MIVLEEVADDGAPSLAAGAGDDDPHTGRLFGRNRRQVQTVRPLECGKSNCEVLDREPGRIEDGRVVWPAATDRVARENGTELCDVVA
jgi:hypothetical protein